MDFIWAIYLIDVLTGLNGWPRSVYVMPIFFLAVLAILSGISNVSDNPTGSENSDVDVFWKTVKNSCLIVRKPIVFLVLFVELTRLVTAFIPSEKAAYTMLAVYGAQELSNQESVSELGGMGVQVIKKAMSDYLEQAPEKLESKIKEVVEYKESLD